MNYFSGEIEGFVAEAPQIVEAKIIYRIKDSLAVMTVAKRLMVGSLSVDGFHQLGWPGE